MTISSQLPLTPPPPPPPPPLDVPSIPGDPVKLGHEARRLLSAAAEIDRNIAQVDKVSRQLHDHWRSAAADAYQNLSHSFTEVFSQRAGRCTELSWNLNAFAGALAQAQGTVSRVCNTELTWQNHDELQAELDQARRNYEDALALVIRQVRGVAGRQQGFTLTPGGSLSALTVIALEGSLRDHRMGAKAVRYEAEAIKSKRRAAPRAHPASSPPPPSLTPDGPGQGPAPATSAADLLAQPGMFVAWGLAGGQYTPQGLAQELAAHGFKWVALQVSNANLPFAPALAAACAQYGIRFGIWEVGDSPQQAVADIENYGASFFIAQVEGPYQDIAGVPDAVRNAFPDMPAAVVTNYGGPGNPSLAQPWIDKGFACLPEAYEQDNPLATPANMVNQGEQLGWQAGQIHPVIGDYHGFDISQELQQTQTLSGNGYSVYNAEEMTSSDWALFGPAPAPGS